MISLKDRLRLLLNRNNYALSRVQFAWDDKATVFDLLLNLDKALAACQSLQDDSAIFDDTLYLYDNWDKIHEFMIENAANYHKLYNPLIDSKRTSNTNCIYVTDIFKKHFINKCVFNTLKTNVTLNGMHLYENKYMFNEFILEKISSDKVIIYKGGLPLFKMKRDGIQIISEDNTFFYFKGLYEDKYDLLSLTNENIGYIEISKIESTENKFLKFILEDETLSNLDIQEITLYLFGLYLLMK